MLTRLAISNLATIESLTIEFGGGFTVLTGETGAGKSILIDALRFVLGERASAHQVRTGARQTLVEAEFDVAALPAVQSLLAGLDIPCQGRLTLRRLLQESGRSRALANDCAITQGRLEAVGDYLVNIHGQHDNRMLLDPATHIDFLDAFAGLTGLREEVGRAHATYSRLLRERRALRDQAGQRELRREELRQAVDELRAANLSPGESEALRRDHAVLTHAEQLGRLLGGARDALYEGEAPIVARLAEVEQLVEQAAAVDERLAAQRDQLGPLRIQLEDVYQALRAAAAALEDDPGRLEAINARLAELEKIERRYGGSTEAALAHLEGAEDELAALDNSEASEEELEREIRDMAAHLHALSTRLSRARTQAGAELDGLILAQLAELGMEHAAFETRIRPLNTGEGKPSYTAGGMDQVEFLLSTNPGQHVRPLSRIASGGELSRTMLALKTVLARADPTKTLIFDEVDAGISGGMAEIVGRKLRALGATHQVLCVTHLPQIAALGHQHVLVSKDSAEGQSFTRAAPLEGRDKVEEVARLLSGIEVTGTTLASAEEMLNRGREAGT